MKTQDFLEMSRYYKYMGKFRGEVCDKEDPEGLKRIRARVPRLGSSEDDPFITTWALPCGIAQSDYHLPDNGEMVWIEFESCDPRFPIWQFGSHRYDDKDSSLTGFTPDNTNHGRRTWLHSNGSGMVADGLDTNERVFIQDLSQVNRVGVGSGRDSVFIEAIHNAVINILEQMQLDIGGIEGTNSGNESWGIVGNVERHIGGGKEETITDTSVTVAGKAIVQGSGEKQILKVFNELNVEIGALEIDTDPDVSGRLELRILTFGEQIGKITLENDGTERVKLNVETSGAMNVDSSDVILTGQQTTKVNAATNFFGTDLLNVAQPMVKGTALTTLVASLESSIAALQTLLGLLTASTTANIAFFASPAIAALSGGTAGAAGAAGTALVTGIASTLTVLGQTIAAINLALTVGNPAGILSTKNYTE